MTRFCRATLSAILMTTLALAVSATDLRADDSITRTFSFPEGGRLEIDTERGNIEYRVARSGGLTVTVTSESGMLAEAMDIRFEETGNGLLIRGDKRRGSGGGFFSRLFGDSDGPSIEFLIEGPERIEAEFKTDGGHINLLDAIEGDATLNTGGGHVQFTGITGSLDVTTGGGHIEGGFVSYGGTLRTGGGHIMIDSAGGDIKSSTGGGHITIGPVNGNVSASTGGGHIRVDEVDGSVDLRSSGGHIKVRSCGGDAEVSSAGGSITLDDMAGYVRASTAGGNMSVRLAEGNGAGADINTSGGGIDLVIPQGIGFDLDADADGAEVEARIPDLRATGRFREGRLSGTIGSGGNPLRLRSHDGDIVISAR